MIYYFVETGRFGVVLWKVPQTLGFTDKKFIDITDLISADYDFVSMIHPVITKEVWDLIPEAKQIVDNSKDEIEFKTIL